MLGFPPEWVVFGSRRVILVPTWATFAPSLYRCYSSRSSPAPYSLPSITAV